MSEPTATPPKQDQAGRLLDEFTLRLKGRPLGCTDAMALLLHAQTAHMAQSDNAREALMHEMTGSRPAQPTAYTASLMHEGQAALFRKLYAYGYDEDTTWDELTVYLPQLFAEAQTLAAKGETPLPIVSPELAVHVGYSFHEADGARRFVQAATPAMTFLAN